MDLTTIISIILGLLFLISGILKIPNLKGFYIIVVSYGLIKGRLAKLFAYTLPFLEVIIGALFIFSSLVLKDNIKEFGYLIYFAPIIAALMLLSNTLAIIIALYKNKKMANCGCYGTAIKVPLSWKKVLENIIWIILVLYVIFSL